MSESFAPARERRCIRVTNTNYHAYFIVARACYIYIYKLRAGDNRTCIYIFPYLRTCARGIPHERRRTDIRKSCSPHPLIVDCLLAPPTYILLAYARMRSVDTVNVEIFDARKFRALWTGPIIFNFRAH